MTNKKYDDSISSLKGADRVRKRPASVLGSNGLDGARHCVKEIIGNSLDEFQSGFGNRLEVGYYEDGSVSVRDFGRGVPMGWNESEKEWNWKLIYAELYAGGKYEDHQEILKNVEDFNDFNYKSIPYLFSVGLNGLGAAAVQYSSRYMVVKSIKNGVCSEMKFERGIEVYPELKVYSVDEENGTFVHWLPDDEVFTDINIRSKWLEELCEETSIAAEIEVDFIDYEKDKKVVFKATTIKDMLEEDIGEKASYRESLYADKIYNHKDSYDVGVCLSKIAIGSGGAGYSYYHNNIAIKGGVHAEAVSLALAMFVRDLGLAGLIKPSDYLYKFSMVISSYSNIVSYRNQTKDSLDNSFVKEGIVSNIRSILAEAWSNKEKWLVNAIKEAQEEAEIRKQLEEQKKQIKDAVKATKTKVKPDKFVSCKSYETGKYHEVELWLLEGDSASGSFKMARDSGYQCYIPLKGKGLNVYKASTERIFANKEILSVMNVLGCGVDFEVEGEQLFDMDKLKVGKIIIASDADADGLHIRMLFFNMIYKLFPQLLYENKVFVANTPKHQVELNDGRTVYCWSDEEFNELRNQGVVVSSIRFKGLGQVNSDVLKYTTVAPETRDLMSLRVDPNDNNITDALEVLFGNSTKRRKTNIFKKMLGDDFTSFEDAIDKLEEDYDSFHLSSKGYEIEEVEFR